MKQIYIPMSVSPAGVARHLNQLVSMAKIGHLTTVEVATRIKLCLPDVSEDLATRMVETDGVFLDEPDGRIGLYPGGSNKCEESLTAPLSSGSLT